MSTKITEECINCGACEPECPNTAIYSGGTPYELGGKTIDALSNDFYYIVPEKCTECVGHFDQEQCAAVCPVDCCVPDPVHTETEDQLLTKAKKIHPEKAFAELSATTSRFRK
jgi:ferredoxin